MKHFDEEYPETVENIEETEEDSNQEKQGEILTESIKSPFTTLKKNNS